MRRWILVILLSLLPVAALAQDEPEPTTADPESVPEKPPRSDRFFFGGGVGLSFGEVDYLEVSPLFGFRVHPKVDLGLSLTYRWRNDDRYDVTTTDYGAAVFGRVRVYRGLFAEADVEYLSWEAIYSDFSEERIGSTSFLAGGGYYVPLGGRVGMAFSALYNFSYDDNDPLQPYGDPWIVRVGVAVGF